jgi:hypothetical protein
VYVLPLIGLALYKRVNSVLKPISSYTNTIL